MTISRPSRVSRLTSLDSSDVSTVTSKRPFWYWSSHLVVASASVGMRSTTSPADAHQLLDGHVDDLLAGDGLERHVAQHRHALREQAAVGREGAGDALGLHERLDRQREVGVEPQAVDAQELEPLVGDLAEGDRPALAHVPAHAPDEVAPEASLVHLVRDRQAHPAQRGGHALHAALVGDDHQLAEAQPLLQVELAHHPEVDEGEDARVEVRRGGCRGAGRRGRSRRPAAA